MSEMHTGQHARVLVCYLAHATVAIQWVMRSKTTSNRTMMQTNGRTTGERYVSAGIRTNQKSSRVTCRILISTVPISCYFDRFKGVDITTALASNRIGKFAYPETETIRRRIRCRIRIYMGALACVSAL